MKKVLIVEDAKMIRKGISTMVGRCGIPIGEILECKNGLEALEIIKNNRVDVMITDIRMPKMDGITLVKELQKQPYIPKIIVISGYDDFSFAVDLLRCGAREYLLKPIKREDLKAIMEKLEAELRKENAEKEGLREVCYGQIRALLSSNTKAGEKVDETGICDRIKNEAYQVICTTNPLKENARKRIFSFF